MGTQRLTERVNFAAMSGAGADAIDEAAGVVRGAGLCGLVSENGRDYPLAVQQRDHVKYEGAKVFFDHTDERTGRKFRDWVGVVRSPSCVASGTRGNLELFKTDPNVPKLLEALRKCPEKFGMSHVAMCRTRREGGREVVEAIESVESVDIVLNPATNPKGFFRHESKGSAVPQISLKQFAERFGPKLGPAKWGALNRVCEDMGGMADAPVMDEPPAEAEAPDLKAALMSAITPMLDEAFESGDASKLIAALKDFIKLHAKHTGKADATPAETPEPEAKESRPTIDGLTAEATAAGITAPTLAHLKAVEGIPTAAGRKAVFEAIAAVGRTTEAETPRSSGKPPGSGPLPKKAAATGASTSRATEGVPTTAADYAKFVRG